MAKYAQLVATGLPPGVSITVKQNGVQVPNLYPSADANAPDNRARTADGNGALSPATFVPNGTYTVAYSGGSASVVVSGAAGLPPNDPTGPDPAGTYGLVNTTTQSGTTYTAVLSDALTMVEFTSASAVTFTIPPNAEVAFPVGSIISGRQYGAGQVTITPGSGVTIRSFAGATKTAGIYAEFSLVKRATNEWVLSGNVST